MEKTTGFITETDCYLFGEGTHPSSPGVIFNPAEIGAQVIFLAARKIFQSVFVLNGDDDAPALLQMGHEDF